MKRSVLLAAFLTSSLAMAGELETKITGFTYTDSRARTAELCGLVMGDEASNAFVTVTVDDKSKKPAKYTTISNESGEFCLVVTSYRGTAIATARAHK